MIVHVICWDGIEYDRNATQEEITREKESGNVKEENGIITFDFSLMRKYKQINHSLGRRCRTRGRYARRKSISR